MNDPYIKTVIYLDRETRRRLDAHAHRVGLPMSNIARRILADRLNDELNLPKAEWFLLGMQLLLRHHPSQDLEEVLNNAQKLAETSRWD